MEFSEMFVEVTGTGLFVPLYECLCWPQCDLDSRPQMVHGHQNEPIGLSPQPPKTSSDSLFSLFSFIHSECRVRNFRLSESRKQLLNIYVTINSLK